MNFGLHHGIINFYNLLCCTLILLTLGTPAAPEINEDQYRLEPLFEISSNGHAVMKELKAVRNLDTVTDREPIEPDPDTLGSDVWQLFSHCGKGFVQFDTTVNARGSSSSPCSTNFIVRIAGTGSIVLRHAITKKYVCFNRRKRITMRTNKNDIKCHFTERINSAGYTMLESTWWPRLYLGFNHKGRFQDPSQFRRKYRCFLFTKFERFAKATELRRCARHAKSGSIRRNRDEFGMIVNSPLHTDSAAYETEQMLFKHVREFLLKKVEAV